MVSVPSVLVIVAMVIVEKIDDSINATRNLVSINCNKGSKSTKPTTTPVQPSFYNPMGELERYCNGACHRRDTVTLFF